MSYDKSHYAFSENVSRPLDFTMLLSAKISNTTYPPLEISILIRGFEHYSETKVIWIKDLVAYFDNIFKLNKRYSGHVITGVIIEA